jgi:hypothetical protein
VTWLRRMRRSRLRLSRRSSSSASASETATSAADLLSNPSGWISRAPAAAPEGASKVASRLGVVVRALATGRVISCNRQPPEADVVHDHVRLCQHQIVAVACTGVRIGTRHVKDAGTARDSQTMGCSSGGGELSPGGGSPEMISDGCSYANGMVLGPGRRRALVATGPTVAALAAGHSGSGSRHQKP